MNVKYLFKLLFEILNKIRIPLLLPSFECIIKEMNFQIRENDDNLFILEYIET